MNTPSLTRKIKRKSVINIVILLLHIIFNNNLQLLAIRALSGTTSIHGHIHCIHTRPARLTQHSIASQIASSSTSSSSIHIQYWNRQHTPRTVPYSTERIGICITSHSHRWIPEGIKKHRNRSCPHKFNDLPLFEEGENIDG